MYLQLALGASEPRIMCHIQSGAEVNLVNVKDYLFFLLNGKGHLIFKRMETRAFFD